MGSNLQGIVIAVLGGDDREKYLVQELLNQGAVIRVAGLPPLGQHIGLTYCKDIQEAVRDANILILPMPGINENGQIRAIYAGEPLILDEKTIEAVMSDTIVFVGVARPRLKELIQNRKLKLIELADTDEVAILNSIPSAEGAIEMAMQELPITVHGSKSLVLGFGRTGMTLARVLAGMGAKVTVFARKPADLARAFEMGFDTLTFPHLSKTLSTADVVYNTVPAMVLTAELLQSGNPGLVIIDLASAPGGTDFKAAEELGIKALLAPGLPGKVAPKTAGLILAEVIPKLIKKELALTDKTAYNGSGN